MLTGPDYYQFMDDPKYPQDTLKRCQTDQDVTGEDCATARGEIRKGELAEESWDRVEKAILPS